MKKIGCQKIIKDEILAKEESIKFFKKIKEQSLFCKEITVSSTIKIADKKSDMSFKYENVQIEPTDVHIKDDNIQIDVFDKFAFFINTNCTNFKFNLQEIPSENSTILCIRYDTNDIIKNIIYISF